MARKRSGVTFRAPRLRTLSWVRPQRPAFAAGRGPPRLSAPERVAASSSGVANAGVSGDSWTWTLDPGPWTQVQVQVQLQVQVQVQGLGSRVQGPGPGIAAHACVRNPARACGDSWT